MKSKLEDLSADRLRDPVRRKLLAGSGAVGLAGFLSGGLSFSGSVMAKGELGGSPLLGFKGIAASTADEIVVAAGYRADVLISWGDPLVNGAAAFDPQGNNSAADQEKQFGDNNDGMSFFAIDENRGVMAINNEYVNEQYLFAHGGSKATSLEDVKKSQAAHGVSIVEVKRGDDNRWQVVRPSGYNRRITATTEMRFSGPAAGDKALQTSADPSGMKVFGTFGNCANGKTPGAPISPAKKTTTPISVLNRQISRLTHSRNAIRLMPPNPNVTGLTSTIALMWLKIPMNLIVTAGSLKSIRWTRTLYR